MVARDGPVTVRSLSAAAYAELRAGSAAYADVLEALVRETEATRKRRDEVRAQGGLAAQLATGVRFVRESNFARFTSTVRRGRTEAGEDTVNGYVLGRLLGAGAYGRVFRCVDAAGAPAAVKVLDKARMKRAAARGGAAGGGGGATDLLREIEVMKKLRHPNLVELREVLDDPACPQLYIVQELCARGCIMPEAEHNTPLEPEAARRASTSGLS